MRIKIVYSTTQISHDISVDILLIDQAYTPGSFSMYVYVLLLSHVSCVRLCATPQTAAHQAPISGILQARTLEWGAVAFSGVYVHMHIYINILSYFDNITVHLYSVNLNKGDNPRQAQRARNCVYQGTAEDLQFRKSVEGLGRLWTRSEKRECPAGVQTVSSLA